MVLDVRVKHYFTYLYAYDIEDYDLLEDLAYQIGAPLHLLSEDGQHKLWSLLFQESRFVTSSSSGAVVFCPFQDFDILYSDMVRNYPSLNLTRESFREMNYYEYDMLFSGLFSTCRSRVETRTQKIPRKPKGLKGDSLTDYNTMVADIRKSKQVINLSRSKVLRYGQLGGGPDEYGGGSV